MRQKTKIFATFEATGVERHFDSVADAAEGTDVLVASIYLVLKGQLERTGGYVFEYDLAVASGVVAKKEAPTNEHRRWCVKCGQESLAALKGVCFRCLKLEDREKATGEVIHELIG